MGLGRREGFPDPTRVTESICHVGQALWASSLDSGLLPLPLCAGDAMAQLLHFGDCSWPAPQVPGGWGQWVILEEGLGRAAP